MYVIFRFESPTERSIAILIELYLQFSQTLPTAIQEAIVGNVKKILIDSLSFYSI